MTDIKRVHSLNLKSENKKLKTNTPSMAGLT